MRKTHPNWLGIIRGTGMVAFNKKHWNHYSILLDTNENDIRSARLPWIMLYLLPFFWDTDIVLDLKIMAENKEARPRDCVWSYSWQLMDLDNNVIKHKSDEIDIKKSYGWQRKKRAIYLDNLSPNKQYILQVSLKNDLGNASDPFKLLAFATKDREEYYMQFFLGIVLIIATIMLTRIGG